MARIRRNLRKGTLGLALLSGDTTITFAADPNLPTLTSGDILALTLDDKEIVHLTAYTAGALTGTILRGQEGTMAVAHEAGRPWQHGPTTGDFEEEAAASASQELFLPEQVASTTSTAAQSTKGTLFKPTQAISVLGVYGITDEASSVALRLAIFQLSASFVQEAEVATSEQFNGNGYLSRFVRYFSAPVTLQPDVFYAVGLVRVAGGSLRVNYWNFSFEDQRANAGVQRGLIRSTSSAPTTGTTWERLASIESYTVGLVIAV